MLKNYSVVVDDSAVSLLVREYVLDSYLNILDNYNSTDSNRIPLFSHNEKEDKKKIKKLCKSFYNVLSWYSTKEEMNGIEKV